MEGTSPTWVKAVVVVEISSSTDSYWGIDAESSQS